MFLSSSSASLQSAKLADLKAIARALKVVPSGDKRRKDTWIKAIQASQQVQEVKVSFEENMERLEKWGEDFASCEDSIDRLDDLIQNSREASAMASQALASLERSSKLLNAKVDYALAKYDDLSMDQLERSEEELCDYFLSLGHTMVEWHLVVWENQLSDLHIEEL